MAIIKCKMCGGDMVLSADKTFGTCEYCGCSMTLPRVDSEQRAAAFNRGNHFRRIGEFDKALSVYERIVRENDADAEAHWCCALCRFGIEYVEDPNTFEWFPTCHRASFDSFLEDVDYLAALQHSDGITQRQYRKDAMKIAEVQKGILAASQNAKSYDVFLCYKETDDSGSRTRDSLLAQEIYYQLTEQGRRVFFARISLEDVPGTRYEPYIFAALNSAKVMIVVGTRPEYLNSPWVKNEWSRFLSMMKKDGTKLLIPCYRDMDPYDLPEQLAVMQSYDMGKLGFLQDLTRGIAKVLDEKPQTLVIQQTAMNTAPLVERAFLFLEDRDWKTADEYCEKVLDMDPKNAEAYFGKLMAEYRISKEEELQYIDPSYTSSSNYQKALRFGDEAMQQKLENLRKDMLYQGAKKLTAQKASREQRKANYLDAISQLQTISDWRDSLQLIAAYQNEIRKIEQQQEAEALEQQRKEQFARERQEQRRRQAEEQRRQQIKKAKKTAHTVKLGLCVLCGILALAILVNSVIVPMLAGKKNEVNHKPEKIISETEPAVTEPISAELSPEEIQYRQAAQLEADGETAKAAIAFGKLGDYSDARERSFALWREITPTQIGCSTDIHKAVVKKDGTVMLLNYTDTRQRQCLEWTDIIAVSSTISSAAHTVGLKKDGTVIAVGANQCNQCNTSSWSDVVTIDTTAHGFTVGLKADGTVYYTGSSLWGYETQIQELSSWQDIAVIRLLSSTVFGIKMDGTVVTASLNLKGERYKDWSDMLNEDWYDIVAITMVGIPYIGNHYLGLKADGTVICTYDDLQREVSNWSDIIAISGGNNYVIGLKSDGTVVSTGQPNHVGPLDFSEWFDMAAIYATSTCAIGVKNDGSLVCAGLEKYLPADLIKNWTDVQQPRGVSIGRQSASMGITVQNAVGAEAGKTGSPTGACVMSTEPGKAAQRAGIQPKDIIIGLDGSEIQTVTDLTRALRNYAAGDTARATVVRNGEELTLFITFDPKE